MTDANAIKIAMQLWDNCSAAIKRAYPNATDEERYQRTKALMDAAIKEGPSQKPISL